MSSILDFYRYTAMTRALKQDWEDYADNVICKLGLLSLESHQPIVIVMSGASGSGKSTLARRLQEGFGAEAVVASADHYFINEKGEYEFKPKNLGKAHDQCKDRTRKYLAAGKSFVIVDNTSTTLKEVDTYQKIATEAGALMVVVSFELPPEMSTLQASLILADRNAHSVPPSHCKAMLERHAYMDFDDRYLHVIHVQTEFTPKELRESQEVYDSLPEPTRTVQPARCCLDAQVRGFPWGMLKAMIDESQTQGLTGHGLESPQHLGLTMGFNMADAAKFARYFVETPIKITCDVSVVDTDCYGNTVQASNVSAIGISKSASQAAIEFLNELVQRPLHVTTGVKNRPPFDAAAVHKSLDLPLATLELLD